MSFNNHVEPQNTPVYYNGKPSVVLAVVMLFLGFRMGMIVGTIVPLTMMLSFIGMQIWDVSLQRMSIAAIIVSLGLLVDNGIVIAKNINTRIIQGMKREAAALAADFNDHINDYPRSYPTGYLGR